MKKSTILQKFIITLFLTNLIILPSSVKSQWQQPDTTIYANCLGSIGNITLSGKIGVSYSYNYGQTWSYTNTGLPPTLLASYSECFLTKANKVFLGININGTLQTSGLFVSNDSGKTWAASVNGMIVGTSVYCMAQKDNLIIAGTDDGIYLSSNDGASWYKPSFYLDNYQLSCVAVNGNTIFAGIMTTGTLSGLGVKVSTNNGATWTDGSGGLPPTTRIYSMVVNNGILFGTATDGRVFKSTNNAASWVLSNTDIPTFYNIVYAINKFGKNLLIGCEYGLYLSSNYGATWVLHNTGLRNNSKIERNSIIQSGGYVFVPANTGIFRRDVNQVSIQNISNVFTNNYKLSQNYPNPFNPTTKIRFEIPKSSFVTMIVYNSLGKEVGVLVNQKLNAGTYEKTFNASGLTSGIYFYKLMTDEFVQTKKMLLVK